MNKPVVLISNDDGLEAKGLKYLYNIIKPFAEVVVVAPLHASSGMSQAITIKTPLYLKKIHKEKDLTIYGTNGTPADSIKLALNQLFTKKPDLILSGINHGSNASISIFYSGTMGAAIEGCLNKIPSIGFSLLDYRPDADFTPSKSYIIHIVNYVLAEGLPDGICYNVNIPVVKEGLIKGVKLCRQTNGLWAEEFDKRINPAGKEYYWLTGQFINFEPDAEDTDEWALKNDFISIVPVHLDLTAHSYIKRARNIEILTIDEKV